MAHLPARPAHAAATAWILDIYSHTYTLNADFNLGQMSGLLATNHQLQFQASLPTQFPYIAVACSDRGTVARVNTTNGIVVGEYRTSPKDAAFNDFPNPSRTTVDQYGNVWVANRDDNWTGEESLGSITRIGLILGGTRYRKNANGTYTVDPLGQYVSLASATYNTCLDRDGDGYIRTSRGLADILPWSNQRGGQTEVDSGGGVSTAEDEAILEYTRVACTGTRTVAVDRWNDIWVGGWMQLEGTKAHLKISGLTGRPFGDSVFYPERGGYGGVIDANGVLWSSGRYQDGDLRLVPPVAFPVQAGDLSQCTTGDPDLDFTLYGIAIDPVRDALWQTAGSVVIRWNTNGTPYLGTNGVVKQYTNGHNPAPGLSCQGLVADLAGHVWVAHGPGHTNVGHLDTNGVYVGSVPLFTNALTGAYFANTNCEAPMVLSRLDGPVDFTNSFGAGVPTSNLSARWTGRFVPATGGTHTFFVNLNARAGVRLYLNNLPLIDNWNTPSTNAVELSASTNLSAGSAVNLRLEYKNPTGSPRVTLSGAWPGQAKTNIPRQRFALSGLQPTGVAVAADGKIWASCLGTHNLMRMDPQGGPLVGSNRLGAVDMVVDLGDGGFHPAPYTYGASPYNYSDMTGFNNRVVNPAGKPLEGWWRVVEDGQLAQRCWTEVSWNPAGSGVLVAVRADDDRVALANQPFVTVTNGVALAGVGGRYLEVRAALRRNSTNTSPVLTDLTVRGYSSTLGGNFTFPNLTASESSNAVFVCGVTGAQLTWQWTVQPAWAMGPTTFFGGPTLTVTNVDQYDDQIWASVLVTEASGDSILLGPATLTVLPTPIVIPTNGTSGKASRYPATITVEGQSAGANGVTIYLDGLSHSKPDDLDILLESPLGKKIMLMSDAGGTTAVANATLGFDSSPGYSLPPDNGPIPSNAQTFYNTFDYEAGDNLPSPAPPGPYTNTLVGVLADNPNGQWRLYINDDATNGSGTLARSWSIIFY